LKLDPESFTARALVAVGFRLLQLLIGTLRFEIDDRSDVRNAPASQRYIGALWHNRLLLIPFVIWRFLPVRRGGGALISASRDGALIAHVVERFTFRPVRGSSSRRGSAALRELADMIAAGRDVLVTPDGPRGPAYEVGPGIVFLAQKTGALVMPINMEYSKCWRLPSWDNFIVPRPFSKVRVIFGMPHPVALTISEPEFEKERQRLKSAMMALVEMR
jgi:lysophospholipid acyltransferase (LPLAT)-like uncharacterized protein